MAALSAILQKITLGQNSAYRQRTQKNFRTCAEVFFVPNLQVIKSNCRGFRRKTGMYNTSQYES